MAFSSSARSQPKSTPGTISRNVCAVARHRCPNARSFCAFYVGIRTDPREAPGMRELSRLRTMVATPVGAFLYGYAFYIPEAAEVLPNWLNQIGGLSLRQ